MQVPTKQVALFDVDKTLLNGYSGYFTMLHLIREGAVRKRRILKAIFYKAVSKLHHFDVRQMYELLLSDTAGWSVPSRVRVERCNPAIPGTSSSGTAMAAPAAPAAPTPTRPTACR